MISRSISMGEEMEFAQERRGSSRVKLGRYATLDFNNNVYEEYLIQDLSLTGMFVQGNFQQTIGDHCVVNFTQKKKYSSLSLKASAQIIRKEEKGVALVFTSIPLESLMILQLVLATQDRENSASRSVESLEDLPFNVCEGL